MPAPFKLTLVVAAALLAAGAAQASVDIDVYLDEADFLAAISNAATDTFDDLVSGQPYDGPLARSAGSVGYLASSSPASPILYGAGETSDAWLSTNNAGDTITFSGFSKAVYAIGAYAFGSDIWGSYLEAGRIVARVTTADGTVSIGASLADLDDYFGFVSSTPITRFEISAVQPVGSFVWPTVNDLTIAAVVPEPGSYALLLAGLAAVGFVAGRRKV